MASLMCVHLSSRSDFYIFLYFDEHRANNGIEGSHQNWQGLCRMVNLSSQPLHGAIQKGRPFSFAVRSQDAV